MALRILLQIIALGILGPVLTLSSCDAPQAEAAASKTPGAKAAACTKDDVKLAINNSNHEFPKILDSCASKAWGKALKTGDCLKKHYPTLSVACTSCFGKMAECSASHCKLKCLMNHFSDKCLACVNSNCRDTKAGSLIECTGIKADKLPPQK